MWVNEFEVERDGRWIMYFYEPLDTDAPANAHPYCCHLNTVVFYKHPLHVRANGMFEEYDRTKTKWNLLGQRWTEADIGFAALAPWVQHDGEVYELAGGRVVRRHGRWFMQWRGRKLPQDDRRLATRNAAG